MAINAGQNDGMDEEDDIFMDKEELLREKLDRMNSDILKACDELRNLQSYDTWLDLALEERELQNYEIMRFVEKKEKLQENNSTTLSDFHAYNIEVLKQERDAMLQHISEKEKELREQLRDKEQALERCHQELFQMNELKNIRKNQETEIEQLDKTARSLRTEFSQAMNQLKAELQQNVTKLDWIGQIQLQQSTTEAQREAIRLVIEKMQEIEEENRLLREEIWSTKQNILALERHLDTLMEQHRQLRRENLQAMDLDYLENRRLEGLLSLQK